MSNPLSRESLEAYYRDNDQYRRANLTVEEASHIGEQVGIVARYIRGIENPRLLEVGADNGSFLALLRLRTGGVAFFDELNPDAIRLMAAHGLQDVRSEPEGARYDAIALRHVLEHIPLPVAYLTGLRERLTSNGIIFIEVPDCSVLGIGQTDGFILEHVNYFSVTSIHAIARRSGLAIAACEFARTEGYSTTPNRVMRLVLRPVDVAVGEDYNRPEHWQALLDASNEKFREIARLLAERRGQRVALYGAGTVSMGYLAYRDSAPAFVRIFDADPKKIGTKLFGVTVNDPEGLEPGGFDFILVTVVGYEAEVCRFLRSKGVGDHQMIVLP